MFVYPADDLDRRATLRALLGSFWDGVFDQDALVEDIVFARAVLERQATSDLDELKACLDRHTIPVWHMRQWTPLTLRESQRNSSEGLLRKYGEAGLTYDGLHRYGVIEAAATSAFDAPAGLQQATWVFDRLATPSVSLMHGEDFVLADGLLIFRDNPFDNAALAKRNVYEGDQVVDREITLWLFRARFEKDYVWTHAGFAVGLNLPSSENYRSYVNALLDAGVVGTSQLDVRTAISAALDVPLVRNAEETVELVDTARSQIVTDLAVYRFRAGMVPAVAVGQTVRRGDPLTTTLQFIECNRGELPTTDEVPALHLGLEWLTPGYSDGLTFVNLNQETTVGSVDGLTEIRFPIGGRPDDVERFWDAIQARGVTKGQTLAQLLDRRANKSGEPAASNLPATINPLHFLFENVLRSNALIVRIDMATIGENHLPFSALRWLRKVSPPHTTLILLFELAGVAAAITMDSEGSDASPGFLSAGACDYCSPYAGDPLASATYLSQSGVLSCQAGCR